MSLDGRRVLITRAAQDATGLQALIVQRGGVPVCLPTIRRVPAVTEALEYGADLLERADAIAVGSLAALTPLVPHMRNVCTAVVGCVGRATADRLAADSALQRFFTGERVVPSVYRAEALVAALEAHFGGRFEGRRIVVPRAPEGRAVLGDGLRAAGAVVDEVVTYRIAPAAPPSPALWTQAQAADIALFMSGETLENFLRIVPEDDARRLLSTAIVGVIGPIAEERAQRLGIRVDVVPSEATQAALVEAVEDYLHLSLRGGS